MFRRDVPGDARLGRHIVLDPGLPLGDAHVRLLPHVAGVQRRRLRLPRHPRARLRFESSAPASRCSRARGRVDQGPHGRAEGRRRGVVQRRRSQEDELTSHKPLPSNNYLLGHITYHIERPSRPSRAADPERARCKWQASRRRGSAPPTPRAAS